MGVAVAGVRLHPVGGAVALLAGATRHLRVTVVVVRTDVTPLAWAGRSQLHSYRLSVSNYVCVNILIDFKLYKLNVEENFTVS